MAWGKKKSGGSGLTLPGMIEALWPDIVAGRRPQLLESKDYRVGPGRTKALRVEPRSHNERLPYRAEEAFAWIIEIVKKNLDNPKPRKVVFHLKWDAGSHTVSFAGRRSTSKPDVQFKEFTRPEQVSAWASEHERIQYLNWYCEITK